MCIKIFLARLIDVSLGTIKTIFMVKGDKLIATTISFIEILIWFVIAKEALNSTDNTLLIAISYSLGYATGTYIGIFLSSLLIKGNYTIQIISSKIKNKDLLLLKSKGFGLTNIKINNNKQYIIIEINKKDLTTLRNLINKLDPHAFMIINETKHIQNGYI